MEDNENHKNYKAKRGYENPELEDLGLKEEVLETRLKKYIKLYNL